MVHYRDAADAGGSLRVGETIANHIDPGRVAVEMVFAYGDAGPVTERAKVPCHFLGAKGPKDFQAWPRVRSFFRSLQPDIIHFQDCVFWVRTALLGTSYLTIAHLHARYQRASEDKYLNASRRHPFEASQLFHLFLKSMDAQVGINQAARRALIEPRWIKPERSYVIYNSIDVDRFEARTDKQRARAEFGLPDDVLLLGMVCQIGRAHV